MVKLGDVVGTLDHTSIADDDLIMVCRGSDGAPALIRADQLKVRYGGPMGRWHRAARVAAVTPTNVLVIGDSLTEGSGCGANGSGYIDDRYLAKMLRLEQARYGQAGGLGFVNSYSTVVPGPNPTTAGTAYWVWNANTGSIVTDQRAFGNRGYDPGTNETLTLHYTGTSFMLQYRQGEAGLGTFTVAVDGGSPVTVTPTTTGGEVYQGTYQSPTLSHGAHAAVITPASGKIAYVHGAVIFDGDEGVGIRFWEHGHGAYTSASFVATNGPGTAVGLANPLSSALCVDPSLVIIFLGINDNGQGLSSSSFQTNISTIIANIKALCSRNPSFLLVGSYQTTGAEIPGYANSITAYNTALAAIAAADPTNVAYTSLLSTISVSGSDGAGDGIHPSTVGHNKIAIALDAALAAA